MKLIVVILAILLVSCAQLLNGQIQPVIVKDVKQNLFYTTCGGAAESWGSCYLKAKKTCPNGYTVIDTYDDPRGIKREYTFKCN